MSALASFFPISWILDIRSKFPILRFVTRWLYRSFNFRLAAYFKLRELLILKGNNTVARLNGPALTDCRAKLLTWRIGQTVSPRHDTEHPAADLVIQVSDGGTLPFELLPELLSSDTVRNFGFAWTESTPPYAPHSDLSDREIEQWNLAPDAFALDLHQPMTAEEWSTPFPNHEHLRTAQLDASRRINELLKIAVPGAICIALALEEDELGFCDTALDQWLPALHEIHIQHPNIIFCLLNRTTRDWDTPRKLEQAGVLAVRSRGLDAISAISLAAQAELFLGYASPYSLAAKDTARSGITILLRDSGSIGYNDEARHWYMAGPELPDVTARMHEIIMEFENVSRPRITE